MNELLKKLDDSILEGRALHAYLLTGTDPSLTDPAARQAAALLLSGSRDTEKLKENPDYMEYSGNISIGEFREVIRPEIYRETYGKAGRAVVMTAANLLAPIVQNAMLKVLEEPPANTYFFLTGNEYGILPTIRSRCMVIRCASRPLEDIKAELFSKGASAEEAKRIARMSGGVTSRAVRLFEDEDFRELRSTVIEAFFSSLRGVPDYKWTKTKRGRTDLLEANEMLLVVCHDMLRSACGLEPEFSPDIAVTVKKASSYFTIREIGCIIEKLKELGLRLSTNASGGASFDRLFTELSAEAYKKKQGIK